ncbi:YfhH family protein [Pseudalkalibacillus sp. A8]|uniref:YfhH family protein n=1 Tax=Pseudalkalibacillus sp. A8 TaxID=3382641 RepID=UPI0038B47AF0
MSRLFSEMSEFEIHEEIRNLTEKARKAEQHGIVNEVAVYERKIAMAKSYLLDPSDFKKGEVYELKNDPGSTFEISYMNGVFAWGYRNDDKELEAFPISMLRSKK